MAKCLPFFPFFITASLVDAQKKSALATFASFKASWKAPGTKESHPIPFRLHEPWFSHLDKVGHLVLRSRLQHVLRNNVSTLYRYYIAYTYGPWILLWKHKSQNILQFSFFFFFSTFSFCFFLLWNWPSDKIFRTLNHLLLLFKSPIAKPRASTCRILKKKKKIVPFFYYLSNPTFIASSLYMHCSHRGLFTVSVFTPTNANASWWGQVFGRLIWCDEFLELLGVRAPNDSCLGQVSSALHAKQVLPSLNECSSVFSSAHVWGSWLCVYMFARTICIHRVLVTGRRFAGAGRWQGNVSEWVWVPWNVSFISPSKNNLMFCSIFCSV